MTFSITLERDHFLAAMQRVIGAVERRSTIPILLHVALTAQNGRLEILGTNLDMQIRTSIPADTKTDAAFTLPAQTLLEILSNFAAGSQVNLSRTDADPRVIVKSARSRFKLPSLPVDDMPTMQLPEADPISMDGADLARALDNVAYAASKEATRYYLCGVYVDGSTLVATDGHRLATDTISETLPNAILPSSFITEAAKAASGSVGVAIGSSRAALITDDVEIISKVIDGSFPDYRRVMPTNNPHALTVSRVELVAAIRRAMIVSADKVRSVRIETTEDGLTVRARNSDSSEGDDVIGCEWTGPADFKVAFAASYMIELCGKLTSETITLELKDTMSPIRIQEGGCVNVVMPMRG